MFNCLGPFTQQLKSSVISQIIWNIATDNLWNVQLLKQWGVRPPHPTLTATPPHPHSHPTAPSLPPPPHRVVWETDSVCLCQTHPLCNYHCEWCLQTIIALFFNYLMRLLVIYFILWNMPITHFNYSFHCIAFCCLWKDVIPLLGREEGQFNIAYADSLLSYFFLI